MLTLPLGADSGIGAYGLAGSGPTTQSSTTYRQGSPTRNRVGGCDPKLGATTKRKEVRMPLSLRNAAVSVATVTLVVLSVGLSSARAAAPGNDLIGGATSATLGFSESLDTSEATTDAVDAAVNSSCGAPATDASVWYAYTPATDGGTIVNVSSSTYSAGVIVATGSPGSLDLVTCGPGAVAFAATANTTYYVLAFDDQFDGGGNGGTLNISLSEAPPPPTIDVTVNPTGTVNAKTGTAAISGTISCLNADFVDVQTALQQRVGARATITGFGGFFTDASTCTGTPQPWTSEIFPQNGKFAGGKTASFTFSFGCGGFECTFGYVEQQVKLRGGKG